MTTAALDTSVCPSFALMHNQRLIVNAWRRSAQNRSEAILLPWMEALLHKSEVSLAAIDKWLVGIGPGSFTGIRTGIALVKGISFGASRTCAGVPSSAALAWPLRGDTPDGGCIGVLHDGRRSQAILTKYSCSGDKLRPIKSPEIIEQKCIADAVEDCAILVTPHENLGHSIPASMRHKLAIVPGVDARCLLECAEYMPCEHPEPIYVRPAVFVKPFAWRKHAPMTA